jgi:hypothetical protein
MALNTKETEGYAIIAAWIVAPIFLKRLLIHNGIVLCFSFFLRALWKIRDIILYKIMLPHNW